MNGFNTQLNPMASIPIIPLINLRPSLDKGRQPEAARPKPAVRQQQAAQAASEARPEIAQQAGREEPARHVVEPEVIHHKRPRPLARLANNDAAPSFYMSLSDLMCLLLVFFVMIFSLTERGESRVMTAEATQVLAQDKPVVADPFPQPAPVSQGLRRGLLGLTAMGQVDPGLTSEAIAAEMPSASFGPQDVDRQNLLGQVRAEVSQIPGFEVAVRGGSVLMRMPETLLFDSAQANLNPNMYPTLQRLGKVMLDFPNTKITITGHTDDRPISTPHFASNWELSGARAAVVARALVQGGLEPSRITISGLADQAPLLPNSSDSNRARNRRVEIELSS